jgi:DNA primase catalytic core
LLSTSTIEQVRDLPIEDVIGKYVQLKKGGMSFRACCPIHDEKTPSFYVTPQKNIFKCFGCGAGGDGIAFVMQKEGIEFIEAVKIIAKNHSISIEETEVQGKTPEQITLEEQAAKWLQLAHEKYRKQLRQHEDAVRYLYSRNLMRDTLIEWQFGLCPDWRVITPDAVSSGHLPPAELAGLVSRSEKDGRVSLYDFFHHRITIPIHNHRGELVGFGGRILPGQDGSKYKNTADSPLYDKSKILFGLHRAIKQFKVHGMAILVEGYLDVIKMDQQGWGNAVATCGTALTESQAKLLKRFTDTVLILRDGDKAGLKAVKNDVPVLLAQGFTVHVCEIPKRKLLVERIEKIDEELKKSCLKGKVANGKLLHGPDPNWQTVNYKFIDIEDDPDSLFDQPFEYICTILDKYQDGVEYICNQFFEDKSTAGLARGIEKCVELFARIGNLVMRNAYIKKIAKAYKLKESDFTKPISQLLQRREDERLAEEQKHAEEFEHFPQWVDRKKMEVDGFVQLFSDTKSHRAGIYFPMDKSLYRVTNFTIRPLYHIFEQSNNRRLIEVNNTHRTSVVEMPTQAFVNQGMFETELLNKGTFRCEAALSRKEFKRLTGWLLDAMPIAYELKTLGWQPEGFFAFADRVYYDSNLVQYDELGMVKVEDRFFMSLGNSKIHRDERQTDNPYENDLYLKYAEPKITFAEWAKLFYESYGIHAPFGIAFTFLTLFKDIVTRITKMPLLYCYGQKGSGKSAMAESITWLFFSGKDGDGYLIKGFNLNPGQSTPFSFYNRLERFRNCPILMNEYDESTVEPWKVGAFKASYDGEGREVGDGDSGKKRKTKIQKVQGTVILVGQYLGMKDDAAVASRSIPANFSLERLKSLTKEQTDSYNYLRELEMEGLSGTLIELMKHRGEVQKSLRKNFSDIQNQLMDEMRSSGMRIEARLISNYSILLAATKSLTDLGIQLPYTFDTFLEQAKDRMIKHNQMLRDNSVVNNFWKAIENLFDAGLVQNGTQLVVRVYPNGLDVKEGGNIVRKEFRGEALLVRFGNLYSLYAKYHRERTGTAAQNEETVLMYLKEQTYFIGLTPSETFNDKRTSAYAFNYDAMKEMGIVLEKNQKAESSPPAQVPAPNNEDETPF